MGTKWDDLVTDGRRLARLIKFLETKMKKVKDDDDSIVRYAQTIGNLISRKVEVVKICDRYNEINSHFTEIEKEKKKQDAIARKWRRKADERGKHELENEIHRAEYQEEQEVEEEKSVRIQMKMKKSQEMR